MPLELEKLIDTNNFKNLLDQAETALKQGLKSNPEDTHKLWRLGEIYRQKGQLEKAISCYKKIIQIDPEQQRANYLFHILTNKLPIPGWPIDNPKAAPFIVIQNFLSTSEIEKVWRQVNINQDIFQESGTIKGINKQKRISKVIGKKDLSEIADFFLEKVTNHVNNSWQNLEVSPFEASHKELQLTMHQDGHFFSKHRDDKGENIKNRKVTFVYYFHKTPKVYQGGDLILFDTDTSKDVNSDSFTKIIPENNCLLLFPSAYYHKVTPISCEENHFLNGRFTLNGWFHDTY